MNRTYISGKLVSQPLLRMEGNKPHMTVQLRVTHKKRDGECKAEDYRINAWNRIAEWSMNNLVQGQIVALEGYLTQNASNNNSIEIVAAEIMPMLGGKAPLKAEGSKVKEMSKKTEAAEMEAAT